MPDDRRDLTANWFNGFGSNASDNRNTAFMGEDGLPWVWEESRGRAVPITESRFAARWEILREAERRAFGPDFGAIR